MILISWYGALLRDGWLGAAAAVWIAATVLPVALLLVLSVAEWVRLTVARQFPSRREVFAARRLRSQLEESV